MEEGGGEAPRFLFATGVIFFALVAASDNLLTGFLAVEVEFLPFDAKLVVLGAVGLDFDFSGDLQHSIRLPG
jgi:hypothetical protein